MVAELTRAFRGTGGDVHDLEQWEKVLSESDSPQSLHAAVKQGVELLDSRIEAVGDQYNRGMGKTSDPLRLLSPKAQSALTRLRGKGQPVDTAEPTAAPAPSIQPAQKPAGASDAQIRAEAQKAIDAGKDPAAVAAQLKAWGIQ